MVEPASDWTRINPRAHLPAWACACVAALSVLWFWGEIPWIGADAAARLLVVSLVVYVFWVPLMIWGTVPKRGWMLVALLDLALAALLAGYADGGLPFVLVIVGVMLAVFAWKHAQT